MKDQTPATCLTGDTAFVRRLDGTITCWDAKAQKLYGWDRDAALGRISHSLLRTKFPYDLDAINKTLLSQGHWEGNLIHTRNDGARFKVTSSWSLKRDESGTPFEILEINTPVRRPQSGIIAEVQAWLLINGLHWFPLIVITVLPVYVTANLWRDMWNGIRVRAWDGSGHYVFGEIYSKTIFPDTFGWIHAFFNGMPFPNFYPPLLHWCSAFLHATGLFSFLTSFKIMIALPTLLIPVVIWILALKLSNRDRTVATAAGLAVLPLLVHWRFEVPFGGLDYFNTFQVGLYTQPLGFILFVLWLVAYMDAGRSRSRFALASVLLALTVLASFFSAFTACLFIAVSTAFSAVRYLKSRSGTSEHRRHLRHVLLARLLSPFLALGLTLFWVVPMLSALDYFSSYPIGWFVVPRLMWAWYGLALLGAVLWARTGSDELRIFLAACLLLVLLVVGGTIVSPRWFPLLAFRFLPILNFLLALPVGYLVAIVISLSLDALNKIPNPYGRRIASGGRAYLWTHPSLLFAVVGVIGVLALSRVISPPAYDLAFYSSDAQSLGSILNFTQRQRKGKYLVEPILYKVGADNIPDAFDSQALSQFLGLFGGEAFSGLYAEASPHRVFFSTQSKAFSPNLRSDPGMKSALTENKMFFEQSLSKHVERVQLLGVRYLVIHSVQMKEQLAQTEGVGARHDFGPWSVFELELEPAPVARPLPYLPALVVSNFSFKQRHAAQYDFVRLAEEQFAAGWFDVLLTLGPEKKIDRLQRLDQFGALILDTYEYVDENNAFVLLHDFAQRRPLILLESDSQLFRRIQGALDQFPGAHIVARKSDEGTPRTEPLALANGPASLAIRENWYEIQSILDAEKVPVPNASSINFDVELTQESIRMKPREPLSQEGVPVLINVTYHPNWRGTDGMQEIYPATPFLMMTFVNESITLVYARRAHERFALAVSGLTLIGLVGFVALTYRQRLRQSRLKRAPFGTPSPTQPRETF